MISDDDDLTVLLVDSAHEILRGLATGESCNWWAKRRDEFEGAMCRINGIGESTGKQSTHRELFDALVDAGVLRDCNNYAEGYYALPGEAAMDPLKGSNFWRVAGACLERMGAAEIVKCTAAKMQDFRWLTSPRAICEAFANAVSEGRTSE